MIQSIIKWIFGSRDEVVKIQAAPAPDRSCARCQGTGVYVTHDEDISHMKVWCHCVEPHRKGAYSIVAGGFIAIEIDEMGRQTLDIPDPESVIEPMIILLGSTDAYLLEKARKGKEIKWENTNTTLRENMNPAIIKEAQRQITERKRQSRLDELGI